MRLRSKKLDQDVVDSALLDDAPLLSGIGRKTLKSLLNKAEIVHLPSGEAIYRDGDDSHCLYVVANGRLQLRSEQENPIVIHREVGRGEAFGAVGLVTGEPRTTTARAIRDSTVLSVSKADFEAAMLKDPKAMLEVTRLVVDSMRRLGPGHEREDQRSTRNIAVIPGHEGMGTYQFARDLAQVLSAPEIVEQESAASAHGSEPALRIDSRYVDEEFGDDASNIEFDDREQNPRLVRWLNTLEGQHRFLVYQGHLDNPVWTRRCLRQADRILMLVDAGKPFSQSTIPAMLGEMQVTAPIEVIQVHTAGELVRSNPIEWREFLNAQRHHHVHLGRLDDVERVVRSITGRALGLVLSGGGARGFAHIGLIKALQERGIKIDFVAGSSMGALIAAMVAVGKSPAEMQDLCRWLFVDNNNLNDYMVPRVSLIRGKKLRNQLEELFGTQRIENLFTGFFCTSTNLTKGKVHIHDTGRLSDWVATSMSIPGIAPPVVVDGDLHVDGGLLNNLPTDLMQSFGRGPIIASDVASEEDMRVPGVEGPDFTSLSKIKKRDQAIGIFSILFRTGTVVGEVERIAHAQFADLYLHHPVEGLGMFAWNALDELVEKAYHYSCEQLDQTDWVRKLPHY